MSALTRFPSDQIVFQPNASSGLLHAAFGLTGGDVLLSLAEFPSLTYAAERAANALRVITPVWLETDHDRVTPARIREQLTDSTAAVMVSLVDSRTGYLADIDGIRQVIGDRLLIVDAIQGFGVVDAPWEVADVVVSGGQKWMRAGWGTGFLALSERAVDHLTPVFSGWTGSGPEQPWDEVRDPVRGAGAFSISNPDLVAEARFAAALEEVAEVGVDAVAAAVSDNVERVLELADEFAVPVSSSRSPNERAGMVVLEPLPEQLTALVRENRAELRPALTELQGVLATLQRHEQDLERTIAALAPFTRLFANTLGTGRWFDTYIQNLTVPVGTVKP